MESSLSLKKSDFEVEVADFLGYTGDPARWTAEMRRHIDSAVRAGLSDFYFPDLGGQVYEWSFLRPTAELSLASGASTLELPDDFNGFVGQTLAVTDGDVPGHQISVGWGVRQKLAAAPDQTGPPGLAEVEAVKGGSVTEGTRFRLLVFPRADRAYTLRGNYSVAPHALSGGRPYVYGGVAHHQTVLWACKAAAEVARDNVLPQQSPCWHSFQQRLRASVAQDRRMAPKRLGYNADRSDVRAVGYYGGRGRSGLRWIDTITIDGELPG